MNCKWCKDSGKLLLVDNYVNCTECEKGKQQELSEKKTYSFSNDTIISPSPKPIIIQPELKKELIVPTPHSIASPGVPRSIQRKPTYYGYREENSNPWSVPVQSTVAPSVIGNAGIPGCGTSTIKNNNIPKILFTSEEIPVRHEFQFEISADRAGAFKPRSIQLKVRCSTDFSFYKSIKILNLSIMGIPQFVNYQKSEKYLDSDFFENETMIDWNVFGSNGQGLQWIVYNPNYYPVFLSVMVKGDPASTEFIGM